MPSALSLVSIFAAIAAAAPTLQGIDFNVVNKAPSATIAGPPAAALTQTAVYNGAAYASSAAAAVASAPIGFKRDVTPVKRQAACAAEAPGTGPTAQPNTVQGFYYYPYYTAAADYALTPIGYTQAYQNFNGSQTGAGYMGLYTLYEYNTTECAEHCNSVSGCMGFDLFFERDPAFNPGPACPNPVAETNIKCTLWGVPVSKAGSTNTGQYREQFQVVITGSNGYNVGSPVPPTLPSFSAAVVLPGVVDLSTSNSAIGAQFYASVYDPSVCAAVCQAQTSANRAAALSAGVHSYTPCNYFNAAVASKAGAAAGMYCTFFSAAQASSSATLTQGTNGGVQYAFSDSLGYTLATADAGTC